MVSVVIPTRNRAAMVCAAVGSTLRQTLLPCEVIVVVDGPEDIPGSSASALKAMAAPMLRVVELPHAYGGAEARNIGVRAAAGEWIAFLDDDDLWLEEKLQRQLDFVKALPAHMEPVVGCRVTALAPQWRETWPRRTYLPGEPIAEYLFCRKGWRYGEALLQSSTLLARRSLLLRVPFSQGLPRHQDWDWLLRVEAEGDVAIRCLGGDPLVVFHVEGERSSVSRAKDWRSSAAWAERLSEHFTRSAMRGFLATECAAQAQSAGLAERVELLSRILRAGPPAFRDLAHAGVFLLVPQGVRRGARNRMRALSAATGILAHST